MIVKSLNKDIFLAYVGKLGKTLRHNVETEISDEIFRNKYFAALEASGEVSIISFGISATDYVSQPEFSSVAEGIYSSAIAIASAGSVSTVTMLPAIAKSATASSFHFTVDSVLALDIDALYRIKVIIPKGFYDATTLSAIINGQTVAYGEGFEPASAHLVASLGTGGDAGKLILTGKTFGVGATIYSYAVTPHDANDVIALVDSVPIVIAQAETVTVTILGPSGLPAPGAKIVLGSYDAITAGALVATSQFQRITKGTAQALYLNTVTVYADNEGIVEIELIDSASTDVYVAAVKPSAYFLAVNPAARLLVAVTQV